MKASVTLTVNGQRHQHDVDARLLLVHFLRDTLGLTGTKIGCDTSQCGSCTVLVDGEAVKSCTVPRGPGRRRIGHHHRRAGGPPARCTRSRKRSGTSTACSAGSARRG